MTNVSVDYSKLNDYATFLANKEVEFNALRKEIESLISSINSNWGGIDSEVFIAKANAYINGLALVTKEFSEYSNFLKTKSKDYNEAIARFHEILRG